jgi:hypothetical protein
LNGSLRAQIYRIDGGPVLYAHSSVGWRFSIKIELIGASIVWKKRSGMTHERNENQLQ